MSESPEKGWFVVLEGGDCAGKTTQMRHLEKHLGEKAVFLQFPFYSGTHTGEILRKLLSSKNGVATDRWDKEIVHLLFVVNRLELMKTIQRFLNDGKMVVCDRYFYSGFAYSMANGLSQIWCEEVEKSAIKPDLIFYLRAPAETTCKRKGFGEQCTETFEMQKKVVEAFDHLLLPLSKTVVINATEDEESMHKEIVRILNRAFP